VVIRLIIIFILSFLNAVLFAQAPDTMWTKTFGGSGHEVGYSVQQTTDDGYIITGSTSSFGAGGEDVWLIKTDDNGDTLWTKTFGDSGFDSGNSVQQTSGGGYVITGVTNMKSGVNLSRIQGKAFLLKTDANGDTLWSKTYKKSRSAKNDWGNSVDTTSDGGYIFTGISGRELGCGIFCLTGGILLVRTNSNGDTIWTKTFGDSSNIMNDGNSVRQTNDGGFIITGSIQSFNLYGNYIDVLLIKTDENGDTLWTKTYGDSGWDSGYSVQQTTDGGYIIAGTELIKTDTNGDTLWTKPYFGYSVQQTTDGGYIIAGGNAIIKTDDNGDTLWTKSFQGVGNSIQQTSDGGYIVAGSQNRDVLLIKIAPDITSIDDNQPVSVNDYQLHQNYPNPFNPSTTIEFSLPQSGFVTLKIYNILGEKVATLVSDRLSPGSYSYVWDASELTSGVYLYRLQAADYIETRKMVLTR
jgi:hypothetical protein